MGRLNNALTMLAILRNGRRFSRDELAKELEVSVREISRYKVDLECSGIHIKYTKGKYGGYELDRKDYLGNLNLTEGEIKALNLMLEDIKLSKKTVPYYLELKKAINKINTINF